MEESKKSTHVFSWVKTIAIAVIIAYIVNVFVFEKAIVEGNSMNPTLINADNLYEDKLSYIFGTPKRGDVVIFDHVKGKYPDYIPLPDPTRQVYVKRVIGLPGEVIDIRDDNFVYINGRKLIEPYIVADNAKAGITLPSNPMSNQAQQYPYTIKDGEVFVMGDNRYNSSDSREFGPVKISVIRGKALFVVFPVKHLGQIPKNCYLQ